MNPVYRAMANVLLAAAATAVGLVLFETGVRFSGLAAKPTAIRRQSAAADPALRGLPRLRRLGRENIRGISHGVLHRTNSQGVRGPEYDPEPAPGVFRIVLVGDSFAMGHGVDESLTYAALTEKWLNDADSGVRFEVINAGLSGFNIRQIVGRLTRIGLPYSPNLIVYGFTPNDIYGPNYVPNTQIQRVAYTRERERFDDSRFHLLRVAWPRWISLRSALDPLVGSHEFALNHNYFHNPAAWGQIERGFAKLGRISRENDLCIEVFIHPVIHELSILHPYRDIYDRTQQAAEGSGLFATQALPHLLNHSAMKLRLGPDDNHPNAEGHRLLALALEEALRRLPEPCFPPLAR